MNDKTKKVLTKVFKKAFLIIFIGFSAMYISQATGYYEFEQYNKKVLTEEKIKEFEQDIKNGKNIDVNNYVVKENKNYESKISKIGDELSSYVESVVVSGLNTTFKYLNNLMG